MADAVTSQTILDGPRNLVMKFTNLSDGTGESAVLKVDVSTFTPPAATVAIKRITYNVQGMVATLLWDATTDVRIIDLAGDGVFDFSRAPIPNTKASGYTGDILLTTTGHSSGDSYSIVVEMIKKF